MEAFVVLSGQGAHFAGNQGREADVTELVATSAQTGGSLGVFRQTIAPKSGPPLHVHRREDEFFFIMRGDFRFQLGDRIVDTPVGSFVFIPRGVAHTFQNVGTEPGVLVAGVTPGGLEQMFADREGVNAEANQALARIYQMEVVGPPLW